MVGTDGASAPPPSPAALKSPWHSPIPYLFGGLAAMLSLIAFALLILSCSYWKLSGYLENGPGGDGGAAGEADLEPGDSGDKQKPTVMEEKYLVIMAGHEKPTFLATPMWDNTASFRSKATCHGSRDTASVEEGKKTETDGRV